MEFCNSRADLYVPNKTDSMEALKRTTHLCIGAHQDDCEIMAYSAVAQCYESDTEWFSAVVLTDGGGSPRSGEYADYTNEQIHVKRSQEQREAADLGKYAAMVQLAYSSQEVRTQKAEQIERELVEILTVAQPETVFMHNPADRHETHLGACLRAIGALRKLPVEYRPKHVYGMEVWRSLDWLGTKERLLFDTAPYPELAEGVISAFESQCTPKKRFDLAALGRRMGNATFQEPRMVDETDSCNIGVDLTPLVQDDALCVIDFTMDLIDRFKKDAKRMLVGLMEDIT